MSFLGRYVKNIPQASQEIFLTFDDGPNPFFTSKVLDLLAKYNAKATFFTIVEHAVANPDLVKRMLCERHTIGNHSWDHNYRMYFATERKLQEWVAMAEKRLSDLIGEKPVGFRSPAGVRTPPLKRVLEQLELPQVLWSKRFYDTAFRFTKARSEKVVGTFSGGDIILFHDGVRTRLELDGLEVILRQSKFKFSALTSSLVSEVFRRV